MNSLPSSCKETREVVYNNNIFLLLLLLHIYNQKKKSSDLHGALITTLD